MDFSGSDVVVAETAVAGAVVEGGADVDADEGFSAGVAEGFAASSGRAIVGLTAGALTPLIPNSSVSKINVEPEGIGPLSSYPYPKEGGIVNVLASPIHMPTKP